MVKLDGEFKGLRTQFTELQKRLVAVQNQSGGGQAMHAMEEIHALRSYVDQEFARLQQGEIASFQRMEQEVRQQLQTAEQRLQQHSATHEDHVQTHTKLRRQYMALEKKIDTKPTGNVQILETKLTTTQTDLAYLKKQIFDSGVLTPKVETAPDEEPAVGVMELGQNALSARLLIRLGLRKYKDAQLKITREESQELLTDEEDSWEHPEDLVKGLKDVEFLPGLPGYFQVTKGWLITCALSMALQLLALVNIFAYGLEHGDNCLDKAPEGVSWWTLHLSKAAGTVVVGCLMAGDVMDTVNYFMVSVLLEAHPGLEVFMSVMFQSLVTLLTLVANSVLFIIATSPDGIWLYVSAVGFVTELSKAVLGVAKSGILGHHIAKEITDLNFQLFFVHQYPWWFQPVRVVSYVAMFGFMGFFALYVSFLPVQECPADGSPARNVFYHFTPEFSQV